MQLDMLVPLESLLEHDSMRVQTYANATLYSLLRDPDIRYKSQVLLHENLLPEKVCTKHNHYGAVESCTIHPPAWTLCSGQVVSSGKNNSSMGIV